MTLRRTLFLLIACVAALAAVLSGCGGGVGTGGTGSFSSNYTYGQITGFGSVIVNGVRFDDSAAQVVDDNGGSRRREDLALGMTISVESDAVAQGSSGPQAKASIVRFGTVLEAPIMSIDVAAGQFVALGQTVRLQTSTVFDDSLASGLSALAVGTPVEVHGYVDVATQSIFATRIEGFTPAGTYKVRGVIAASNTGARTLRIGAADFDYASAADVPASLAVGEVVTVYAQATPSASGAYVVTRFNSGSISRPSGDHDDADIRGVVTAFTDSRNFTVNDVRVDASAATFPDGTNFSLGSRVKVEGRVTSGVLVADKVEIDSDDRVVGEGIDLRGAIESVDAGATTFRLRGSTVFYGGNVEFKDGTVADLAVGKSVRVKGKLSADRARVEAAEIRFE